MGRTKHRPIAEGIISQKNALLFAIILGIISFLSLFFINNLLSALLALGGGFFYVAIYTLYLKKRTIQNIVVGGAAGAFPPLVGYAAVSNTITLEAIYLFVIIFFWTPPHFWALAIYRKDDYAKQSIPMLPVTHGVAFTKLQIVLYTIILFLVSLFPYIVLMSGTIYLVAALILSSLFLFYSVRLYLSDDDKYAMQTFWFSIYYIFLIFIALIVDHFISI